MEADSVSIALSPHLSGSAVGPLLVLDEPLSLWGGVDFTSGEIVDAHHPQVGDVITARILVLPAGRGSSSSSSVFAELVRRDAAPAAVLLADLDPILAVGALVAEKLYGHRVPFYGLSRADMLNLRSGTRARIEDDSLLVPDGSERAGDTG